jgi:hypothetical protein
LRIVDTSALALSASLRKLREAAARADRAVDAKESLTAPDLRRAERLIKGGGAVFEDIQLGASVTVDAAKGLADKAGLTPRPRETSLGTTLWGRRVAPRSFTVALRAAVAVVAALGMCAPPSPAAAPVLCDRLL